MTLFDQHYHMGSPCPDPSCIERYPGVFVSTAQTRHEAHEAIQPHKRTLKDQVYAYIAINGPVTDQQIAIGLNMPENTARPRRLELAKDGKIKIAGSMLTRKRRKAVAWMVTTSDDQGTF